MDRRSFLWSGATLVGSTKSMRAEAPAGQLTKASCTPWFATAGTLRRELAAVPPREQPRDRFTKGLPHSDTYEVSAQSLHAFDAALAAGDAEAVDRALDGSAAVNPMAAHALQPWGQDAPGYRLAEPPRPGDPGFDSEAIEVLWAAICRDVPFARYHSDPLVGEARAELGLPEPADAPFGPASARPGPVVSQFLLRDLAGSQQPCGRSLAQPGLDYATDLPSFLHLQNGLRAGRTMAWQKAALHPHCGRSLASVVYDDDPAQLFIHAAQQLFREGRAALNPSHPYASLRSQVPFATWGAPHCFALLGQVTCQALTVAWFNKWLVHRYPRPEEFFGHAHFAKTGRMSATLSPAIGESVALRKVVERAGSYLLPLAYPEGAPLHPSYPAGHAVYAGACATVLKAFFDPDRLIEAPVEPTADGTVLRPYAGPLSVGDEIDKLVWNVSFGRVFAGVHWRFDCEAGIALGEEIAHDVLREALFRCAERHGTLRYRTFFGTESIITSLPSA